jgi:Na+-transporting NADH:ubiquinone oxidoreductase subunit F
MLEIGLGVGIFTAIIVVLAGIIMLARMLLIETGFVHIEISNAPEKSFDTQAGSKLLEVLAAEEIFLSSACAGTGICGQCRVKVLAGGGQILPTERDLINKKDAAEGYRLACQLTIHRPLMLELPAEVFGVRKWTCRVVSNRNVATFIKELILLLPQGEEIDFEPGSYVLIEAPAHHVKYIDFDIDEKFRPAWDACNIRHLESYVKEPLMRAYTMASYPGEGDNIRFNIRIALPPLSSRGIPPGKMSSYLFSLKSGDTVTMAGPYGEFFPRYTDAEMIYVGGGSGMAPMRSHLFYLLKERGVKRKISFWYGARSLDEIFYQDEFNALQEQFDNFSWYIALSEPKDDDHWQGERGYIHQVLYEKYLSTHKAPEGCEYYICGPPMMMDAVMDVLRNLNVSEDHIYFDDFNA